MILNCVHFTTQPYNTPTWILLLNVVTRGFLKARSDNDNNVCWLSAALFCGNFHADQEVSARPLSRIEGRMEKDCLCLHNIRFRFARHGFPL